MRHVDIVGVRVEMPTNQPLVLLRESQSGRHLPIWIGAVEATAIAFAQQAAESPRPMTHELMASIIEALGDQLVEVHIVKVVDNVFFAELIFGSGTVVEARPSDCLALALRCNAEVLCADEVLDEAGIVLGTDEDEEIEKFREFLDEVDPEDFDS